MPYLDVFGLTVKSFGEHGGHAKIPSKRGFQINPGRLQKQVIYFALTAQIVNFALEVVVPFVKRKSTHKVKQIKDQRAAKRGGSTTGAAYDDPPEEAAFLARVRGEAELEEYDVTVDLREMVIQVCSPHRPQATTF